MSATTQAIEVIDGLVKDNISRETATKLIDFAERQKGDLATRQDVQTIVKQEVQAVRTEVQAVKQEVQTIVKQEVQAVRTELQTIVKQEVQAVRTELQTIVKQEVQAVRTEVQAVKTELKNDINWLKWVISLLSAFIIGLGSLMVYLHSDTKSEMKEIKKLLQK